MIDDIKRTLWATADKLRANMDAAEYKHLVLGLIFVKYISDTFQAKRTELAARFADATDDYFLPDSRPELLAGELEDRDYYREVNVFWVPEAARWEALRAAAKQTDIGKRIDEALSLIEAENPKLKGILDKRFARAEGKRGGQFYTPRSIVKTLVAVLAPHHGKVYDPCCGSGGMFVQGEEFIEAHGGKLGDVAIFGQEANPTTWRLAAMNLAIRGIDFNLGREPADTFTRDQFPDLRADFILANPPFNISDWWHASLTGDARWVHGDPPQDNANYAWLQHMQHPLKPGGRAGIVLANGSMSSSQNNEGQIRAAMVDADVVEVMIGAAGAAVLQHADPGVPVVPGEGKSWFVDFDPVRAKQQGLAPTGMDEATAALFPDSFVESALGLVPNGWRAGTMGNLCSRAENGGTPKRSVPAYWQGSVPWLTSGEVRSPVIFDTREKISELGMKESSAKLWPLGTTVVAMYGATAGEVCFLAEAATANQACCGLVPLENCRSYLFFCARRERQSLASKSSGSAQQNLNKALVCGHPVLVPSDLTIGAYESFAGALLDGWIENERRAQTLATLRDTLLPRLISGQLRLPAASPQLDEAIA